MKEARPTVPVVLPRTISHSEPARGYSNGIAKEQLTLQELMAEKDRVEAELKALGQVLDSVRKSGL